MSEEQHFPVWGNSEWLCGFQIVMKFAIFQSAGVCDAVRLSRLSAGHVRDKTSPLTQTAHPVTLYSVTRGHNTHLLQEPASDKVFKFWIFSAARQTLLRKSTTTSVSPPTTRSSSIPDCLHWFDVVLFGTAAPSTYQSIPEVEGNKLLCSSSHNTPQHRYSKWEAEKRAVVGPTCTQKNRQPSRADAPFIQMSFEHTRSHLMAPYFALHTFNEQLTGRNRKSLL